MGPAQAYSRLAVGAPSVLPTKRKKRGAGLKSKKRTSAEVEGVQRGEVEERGRETTEPGDPAIGVNVLPPAVKKRKKVFKSVARKRSRPNRTFHPMDESDSDYEPPARAHSPRVPSSSPTSNSGDMRGWNDGSHFSFCL